MSQKLFVIFMSHPWVTNLRNDKLESQWRFGKKFSFFSICLLLFAYSCRVAFYMKTAVDKELEIKVCPICHLLILCKTCVPLWHVQNLFQELLMYYHFRDGYFFWFQGFGVTAKNTAECKHADPLTVIVFNQSDIGEYIRCEDELL